MIPPIFYPNTGEGPTDIFLAFLAVLALWCLILLTVVPLISLIWRAIRPFVRFMHWYD